jgi:hypothetical protein
MTYLGANLICDLLESLPHSLDRAGRFEDDSSTRSRFVLELSLGALVDVTDDFIHGLLELRARSELVGRKGDAFRVLARNVHAWKSRTATDGQRGAIASCIAIGAVGDDRSGLLTPGGRDRSLSTGLNRTKSWEGLLRRGVQGRLLGSRGIIRLLLAGSLLAQRRIRGRVGRGRGRGMSDVFLIRDVLDSDVMIMLLHQLLGWGKTLSGRAGDCFGCHFSV